MFNESPKLGGLIKKEQGSSEKFLMVLDINPEHTEESIVESHRI